MRRLLQPGLLALLVLGLAAVPAIAGDWQAGDRSTVEVSSASQTQEYQPD
jgi:hypothetical protein